MDQFAPFREWVYSEFCGSHSLSGFLFGMIHHVGIRGMTVQERSVSVNFVKGLWLLHGLTLYSLSPKLDHF